MHPPKDGCMAAAQPPIYKVGNWNEKRSSEISAEPVLMQLVNNNCDTKIEHQLSRRQGMKLILSTWF